MKLSQSRRGFLAVVIAGACLLPSVSSAAVTVVGTGPDSSFLVLESPNLGLRTYEVRYSYNPGTQSGYFLLDQVFAAEPSLIHPISDPENYFLSFLTYNSVNETYDGTNYWTHWVAGGAGFSNPDYSYNPGQAPDGDWTFGYGISSHIIEPNSWDAFYFSDGNTAPNIAPVPETSSAFLTAIGSLVIFKRRRNA